MKIKNNIKNNINKGGIIFMYHRIANIGWDPWDISVTPKNFENHLKVLKKYFILFNYSKYLNKRSTTRFHLKRYAAVTFDDGYADNYYYAKPLLEKYEIPATFFVVSGSINQKEQYWWDKVSRFIDKNYEEIKNKYLDSVQHDELYVSFILSKLEMCKSLHKYLQPLPNEKRLEILEKLENKFTSVDNITKYDYPMTANQVNDLKNGLFEIGGHTVSHPLLSTLPYNEQKAEIQKSKYEIEEVINNRIDCFSYPHGDYNEITLQIMKESGFQSACTVKHGKVYYASNLYEIPRVKVKNWSGEEFERRIMKLL